MSIIASLRVREEKNRSETLKFIGYICKFLFTVSILGLLWIIDSNSVYNMFYSIKDFIPLTLVETLGTWFINLFVISIMYGLTRIFVEFTLNALLWIFLIILLFIGAILVIYSKMTE